MKQNPARFAALFALAAAIANAAERPNILVFLSDDHSAPHLGCYNNPDIHTPSLDRFAAQGMRFDRAYVTEPLPMDVVTYPELRRRAGYFTGVAGRTHHLDGTRTPDASAKVFAEHQLETFSRRLDSVKTADMIKEKMSVNEKVLKQFGEFLDLVPPGRPFCLQLCTSGPHASGTLGRTSVFDLSRTVVTKTHKLIYNLLWNEPYTPVDFGDSPAWKSTVRAAEHGKVPPGLIPYYTGGKRPIFEVYDLVNDPDDLNNLAGYEHYLNQAANH